MKVTVTAFLFAERNMEVDHVCCGVMGAGVMGSCWLLAKILSLQLQIYSVI